MADPRLEPELSLQARELIRSYMVKFVLPSGLGLTIVSFLLGYVVNDVARKDAYVNAYAKAYEEATKAQSSVVAQSAARVADAEVNAKAATKAMTEALDIAAKIKAIESITKADAQLNAIAKELAGNPEFANRITMQLNTQLATTNKWLKNIYGQAAQVGMPNHQGANGWWQKSLIDAAPAVNQELR